MIWQPNLDDETDTMSWADAESIEESPSECGPVGSDPIADKSKEVDPYLPRSFTF